jgi:hypothetical protein
VPVYTPFWSKNAVVRIGGNTYAARTWTVTVTAEVLDGMSMEDNGAEHPVAGPIGLEVTITSLTDSGQNPYAAPLNMVAGAMLSDVRLYQSGPASGYWGLPTAFVVSSSQTADARALMAGTVTLRAVGTWTPPA